MSLLSTAPVLYMRFEETLIGVGVGAAMAAIVLPIGTRARVREEVVTVLEVLGSYLDKVGLQVAGECSRCLSLQGLRELDRALQGLREAARPLTGRFGTLNHSEFVHKLLQIYALVYYARNLLPVAETAAAQIDPSGKALVLSASKILTGNLGDLTLALIKNQPLKPIRSAAGLIDRAAPKVSSHASERAASEHRLPAGAILLKTLRSIDEVVNDLGKGFTIWQS